MTRTNPLQGHENISKIESLLYKLKSPYSKSSENPKFVKALKKQTPNIDGEKVFLVCGTNGKGSVAKCLSYFLEEGVLAKRATRVGLFISPRLECITERIQVNGRPISKDIFIKSFKSLSQQNLFEGLSFFDALCLMACDVFFSDHYCDPVDFAVFEVGLGGRFDATNFIPHHMTILTNIGNDHLKSLGPSLRDIAGHKVGAMPSQGDFIYNYFPYEDILDNELKRTNGLAKVHKVPDWPILETSAMIKPKDSLSYSILTPFGELNSPIAAKYFAENMKVAFFSYLKIVENLVSKSDEKSGKNIKLRLQTFKRDLFKREKNWDPNFWPGRFHQIMICNKRVIISGAHNSDAWKVLAEELKKRKFKKIGLIIGLGKNKDFLEFNEHFKFAKIKALGISGFFKAKNNKDYKSLGIKDVVDLPNLSSFFRDEFESYFNSEDLLVITGSLYLAGEVYKSLRTLGLYS